MSKDIPEVNDIWIVNGHEFFIASTTVRIDAIDGITKKKVLLLRLQIKKILQRAVNILVKVK